MFHGYAERLCKEVKALAPSTAEVKVVEPSNRIFSAWIGAQIFSSLSSFESRWITRAEYDEAGAGIVHRKCI